MTLHWIHFYDVVLAIVLEHSATEMKPCYGKEFRKAGNTGCIPRAMNTEKSLKLSRHGYFIHVAFVTFFNKKFI